MSQSTRQAVYSSDFSTVYIQFQNGSLYNLNIPTTAQSTFDVNSHLSQIASAPANSSLVLSNTGDLYAIWGAYGCYSSPIEVSKYNLQLNSWSTVAQSGPQQQWHSEEQTVWIDRLENVIYLYGGLCGGNTQSGFFSYSIKNQTFSRVNNVNGIQPHEMAGAQPIPLNDFQTLLVGGRASSNAWISMQQVAIWGQSSWSFNLVGNSTQIDSREQPLLLPIWSPGTNGTSGALNQVLVIGGTVAGRDAEPKVAALNNSPSKGWYWTVPTFETGNLDEAEGLFSIFNTLANANSSNGNLTLYGKSSQSDVWSSVQQVSVPASDENKTNTEEHKKSPAAIAVVSTLLPIIVIALLAFGVWWFWRRRRERKLFQKSSGNRRFTVGSFETVDNPFSDTSAWKRQSLDRFNDKDSVVLEDGNAVLSRKRSLRVVNPDE